MLINIYNIHTSLQLKAVKIRTPKRARLATQNTQSKFSKLPALQRDKYQGTQVTDAYALFYRKYKIFDHA